MRKRVHRIGLTSLFWILVFFVPTATCSANAFNDGDVMWKTVATRHTVIHYQDRLDLENFYSGISDLPNAEKEPGSVHPEEMFNLAASVSRAVDSLFKSSCDILGMDGFVNTINVKIFSSKEQQKAAFHDLYNRECTVRAWYAHEKLTIYTQVNDINPGMLAHEFAHAIIDHYMIIPPPVESAEILARHVDTQITGQRHGKTSPVLPGHLRGYSAK